MQHLAQEIPKLLIVGNRENIWWGWRGNHSAYTLVLYSFPKHLPLLSKAGYWAGWIFHLTWDGSSCVFGGGVGCGCEPPSSGSEDPKHDFPLLPKALWL